MKLICRCYVFMLILAATASVVSARDERGPIVVETVVLSPLREAEIPAQQTGVLQEIVASEGETAASGAVIAQLDNRQAVLDVSKAKLESAQAAARAANQTKLLYAEKSLEVARAELRRSEESIAQFAKSISQSQLDVERLTVEKLELEKKQARHELELEQFSEQLKEQELAAARLRLEQHLVRAPFAGTIALIRGRVGEWIEVGESVARLVDIDTLRAEGFLDAGQATDDLLHKRVLFHADVEAGSIEVEGVLQFVSPEMDPVTKQVRIWAQIQNPNQVLRSGQQGTLEIFP